MANGWDAKREIFVQHFGSDALDAANLMMPLVFFVSPTEPRMLKTLDATCQPPERGGWFRIAWCIATTSSTLQTV